MRRFLRRLFRRAPPMLPLTLYPSVQSVRLPPPVPTLKGKLLAVHVHQAMRKSALD